MIIRMTLSRAHISVDAADPFPFSALTLSVGQNRKDIHLVKTRCWFVCVDDLTGALHDL